MKTAGFGWLTYDYDAQRLEEIRLESFNTSFPTLEVWLALDRATDRDARGRPTSRWSPVVDVQHVDVAVAAFRRHRHYLGLLARLNGEFIRRDERLGEVLTSFDKHWPQISLSHSRVCLTAAHDPEAAHRGSSWSGAGGVESDRI